MDVNFLVILIGLVILSSLIGGFIPYTLRLTHTRLQMLLSFVGGTLLGVGVLHMLPHATFELGSIDTSAVAVLVGLVGMFFLTRVFHVHHHGSVDEQAHDDHLHSDDEQTAIACELHERPLSWIVLAVGLAFHSLVDGVALASSFEVTMHSDHSEWQLGVGTLVAILLHKPFDSLSLISVMIAAGLSWRTTLMANVAFALLCPLGIGLFYLGLTISGEDSTRVVGWSLGISAGAFLCIALGDILPEVRFHSHDKLSLSACFLAGILVSGGLRMIDPHHHDPPGNHQHHDPEHQPADEDAHKHAGMSVGERIAGLARTRLDLETSLATVTEHSTSDG